MKGILDYELPFGHHRITYATPFPVLVCANDKPVDVIQGSGVARVRKFSGKLTFQPTDKGEYNVDIDTTEWSETETQDFNSEPPPAPPPASNYLAQLRNKVKMSMGIIREEFAEQGKTVYEVTDEEAEGLRQSVLSKAKEEKAKSEEGAKPTTPNEAQATTPNEAPSAEASD